MSGRYAVEGVIGRGGAGVVYRARQVDTAGRTVAYKRVAGAGPQALQQLRTEVEALAACDHPNIVRIFDVVPDGDGFAIVMQYAAGGSLSQRLRDGALTGADAGPILLALADALASAHARGILHGDIKPANILFTADGHPMLSDFGTAMTAGEGFAPRPTAATLEYLDPAVAAGAAYDEHADIYALGVVGRELLTGSTPAGAAATALAAIVAEALSPQRHRRPTAAALAAQLRETLATRPVAVASAPPAADTRGCSDPATMPFGPRPPRARTQDEARDLSPWRWVAAAALALIVIPSLVVVGLGRSSSQAAPASDDAPTAAAADTAQGPTSVRYRNGILRATLPGRSEPVRVRLGAAGDQVVVGDWDCDGVRTVALYQTRTGKVFEFGAWPGARQPLNSSTAYATGVAGGIASVSSGPDCDAVVITPAMGA